MTDLMDIGRSGLAAYRTALTVTGENIANAETQGYAKRNVVMRETGVAGGVEVVDIARAFDTLLAERNRNAQMSVAASQTYLTHMKTLEERLLPGVDGVARLSDGFFDAADAVSMSPSDTGLRNAALSAAQTLAGGISDLSLGLHALAKGVQGEMGQSIAQANVMLEDLARLQGQMTLTSRNGAQNALVDQRDRLLDQIGSLFEVNVAYDKHNLATVRLSADAGGPVLAVGGFHARLTGDAEGRVTVVPAGTQETAVTRMPTAGTLGGLAQAAGTIGQAIADLDGWADLIATQMNRAHGQGVTSTGQPGGELFTTSGWTTTPGTLMRGDAVVSVTIANSAMMPEGPLNLVYDGSAGRWSLTGADDAELASGKAQLAAPGLAIEITGTPMNGDRITLHRHDGAAQFMSFRLTAPEQLAAAGALTASAVPGNQGTAALAVKPALPASTALPDLTEGFNATASEFLKNGVVGVIPAGSGAVALSVQPRLDSFEAGLPAGATVQSLRVTTQEGDFDFALAQDVDLSAGLAGVNAGRILSTQGRSLSDLGLTAQAIDGVVAVSVREGMSAPAAIMLSTSAGMLNAPKVSDASPAAALSIFTKDGRQLSGPPMAPTAAANLLRPENGFDPQAVYSTEYLSAGSDYAGLTRSQSLGGGGFTALVAGESGLTVWPSEQRPPETNAQQLSFEGDGLAKTVALPQGASAAWRAQVLGAELPLDATAETRLALDLPATGMVSLQVSGDNLTSKTVNLDLTVGGAEGAAQAFNAVASSTGIRAEPAANGNGVILIQSGGADITLAQITHDGGAPITATRLASNGDPLGSTSLASDGGQSLRVAGTVSLSGAAAFGYFDGTVFVEAGQDPFQTGPIALSFGAARTTAELSLTEVAADDMALRSVNIIGGDGRVLQAEANPAAVTEGSLAQALIADMRAGAPASRMAGAALAALPADGTMMRFSLGDEDYSITMTSGQPVVAGPEAARISATFNASNQLVIETNGGTLDGAALQLPADAGQAARFGMGTTQGPVVTVIGQPFSASNLPASFMIRLGGVEHSVSVSTGGIILPPSFPGTGRINTAYGTIEIQFDARGGAFSIPAQQGAADVGLDTADVTARLKNGAIALTATDGRALEISSPSTGSGMTVQLSDRPNEDLLVVLSGDGALRLSGQLQPEPSQSRPQEIRVLDAGQGIIGLFDTQSGAHLATRKLDANGSADVGGVSISLSGTAVTGDRFSLMQNSGASGDARAMEDLANLRQRDAQTGEGGYGALFASIQQRVGTQVNAAQMRFDTAMAEGESAQLAVSQLAGVDLDAEAARLMQQQQAYQANAQVLTTAREIFDTLLSAI